MRIAPLALAAALPALAACGDWPDASDDPSRAEWITEPDYRIGDAVEGDAVFGRVPYLRVAPSGHVFVVEAMASRVSVWTPSGKHVFSLGGPGAGPGDFMLPYKIHFEDTRFYVRDQSRFTWFGYDRGILETVPSPPTSVGWRGFPLRLDALLADGSFLGLSQLPFSVRLGLLGDDPVDRTPLFSVRNTEEGWVSEPVYWIDHRRSLYAIPSLEGIGYYYQGQPYWESDQYQFDPLTGTVVVARVAGEGLGPGDVDLIEITARGDTAWRRRLRFEPVPVTPGMAQAEIEALVERAGGMSRGDDLNRRLRHAREVIEKTVRIPPYAPAVKTLTMASSGQLWIRSHEKSDTLSVWYSVDRDAESPPRRVLLPEWLFVRDATETHVWGVWRDELDINYVVGRRLALAPARRR